MGCPSSFLAPLVGPSTIKSHWARIFLGAGLVLYSRTPPFLRLPRESGLASKKNPFPVMGRKELICWSEVDLSEDGIGACIGGRKEKETRRNPAHAGFIAYAPHKVRYVAQITLYVM